MRWRFGPEQVAHIALRPAGDHTDALTQSKWFGQEALTFDSG
jgi:hypothetical protein